MKRLLSVLSLASFLLIIPTEAHANVGLPMIVVIWPLFWVAIIPIILIEWFVMKRRLLAIPSKKLLSAASLSNVLSTLFGIPIVWAVLFFLEVCSPGGGGTYPGLSFPLQMILSVTVQAPWLVPYETQLYWMIPAAFLFLLIPFYFVSAWLESWITIIYLRKNYGEHVGSVKQAVWKANLYSYLFLGTFGLLAIKINLLGAYIPSFVPAFIYKSIAMFSSMMMSLIRWLMGH